MRASRDYFCTVECETADTRRYAHLHAVKIARSGRYDHDKIAGGSTVVLHGCARGHTGTGTVQSKAVTRH